MPESRLWNPYLKEYKDRAIYEAQSLSHLSDDELLHINDLCPVCKGTSPIWDGHALNPPCQGASRTALVYRAIVQGLTDGE